MELIFSNDEFIGKNKLYHSGQYIEHRVLYMHSHEFWEISYVYEGSGEHRLGNGRSQKIEAGDFLFITPGIQHCIISTNADKGNWVRTYNFLITEEYMKKLTAALCSMREFDEYSLRNDLADNKTFWFKLRDERSIMHNLIMNAAYEDRHFCAGSESIMWNLAVNMLLCMTRIYENSLKPAPLKKDDIVDELKQYIRSNFSGHITLDYLAAYVHLAPAYLSRHFKNCTGQTLSDYISEIRIERAKYLLRTSSKTINDISLLCGYNTISNFQKSFKRSVGMSAGEYRKQNQL